MKKLLLAVLFLLGAPSFALASPTVTITSPNGGETFAVGSVAHITWTSTNVDKVTIFYQASSGTTDYVANNIVNTGSYDWTVNVGNTTNTQFKIWILAYQTGVGQANDYSDNYFTVNKTNTTSVTATPVASTLAPATTEFRLETVGPNPAQAGTEVIVTGGGGTGYSLTTDWNKVLLMKDGKITTISNLYSSNGRSLTARLPVSLEAGTYNVSVQTGNGVTSSNNLSLIVTSMPQACATFPCFFDAKGLRNNWSTIDAPPSIISALYPYELTLASQANVVMTLRAQVWVQSPSSTGNTMYVKVDGTQVYSLPAVSASTDTHTINLGTLAAGVHKIEIYANPDPEHFHIDWFKLENSTIVTTSSPVITSYYASPSQVTSGQTATLYWLTNNSTSCSIPGRSLAASGSTVVGPLLDWDSTFTLTCVGSGGSTSKTVTIPVASSGVRLQTANFTKNLIYGDVDPDVVILQKVLNMNADTQVATSGVGSSGNETSTFDLATKNAVIKFQNKYASEVLSTKGLTVGDGFVDAPTRAKLNAVPYFVDTPISSQISVPTTVAIMSPTFGSTWEIGKTYTIKWKVDGPLATRTVRAVGYANGVKIDKYLGDTNGDQLDFTVSTQMPEGKYELFVCGRFCPFEGGIGSSSTWVTVVKPKNMSVNTTTTLPVGCTSTAGYSVTTGKSCTAMNVVATPASIIVGGADTDPSGIQSCIDLAVNMRYRMRDSQTNNEVSELQDFLNAEGYLASQPTGFFGLATLAAVKKFQSANGFVATGYVGALTRAKIKTKSCSSI